MIVALVSIGIAMLFVGIFSAQIIRARRQRDPNKAFPFSKPKGSDVDMFIQWKGTYLCLDFNCPCGYNGHIDSDFVYYVFCPRCNTYYRMGTQVIAKRLTTEQVIEQNPRSVTLGDGCW